MDWDQSRYDADTAAEVSDLARHLQIERQDFEDGLDNLIEQNLAQRADGDYIGKQEVEVAIQAIAMRRTDEKSGRFSPVLLALALERLAELPPAERKNVRIRSQRRATPLGTPVGVLREEVQP